MSKHDEFRARVPPGGGTDFRIPVLNATEPDIRGAEDDPTWLPVNPPWHARPGAKQDPWRDLRGGRTEPGHV